MSRLYANTATMTEIASQFRVEPQDGLVVAVNAIEGDPGLVVLDLE